MSGDSGSGAGSLRKFVEWLGTHPLALGSIAIVGIAGFGLTLFGFQADRSEAQATSTQGNQIRGSIDQLAADSAAREQGIQNSIQNLQVSTPRTPQDRIPNIVERNYPEARQALLDSGWVPTRTHWTELEGWLPDDVAIWNFGFSELTGCAGTGEHPCRFEWVDPLGTRLIVSTVGELDAEVNYQDRRFVGRVDWSRFTVASVWIETETPGDVANSANAR